MAEEASEVTLPQLQSWKQGDGQAVTALFPGFMIHLHYSGPLRYLANLINVYKQDLIPNACAVGMI